MALDVAVRADFARQALANRGALYGLALRLTRDASEAEDLVQDALLLGLAAWRGAVGGSSCRAWLVRILMNRFISAYRRGRRARRYARGAGQAVSDEPAAEAPRDDALSDEVEAALDDLPPRFREVVELCDLQGASYRDAARRIGRPVGTVMSRLHRGRRLLERRLAPLARERGILRQAA